MQSGNHTPGYSRNLWKLLLCLLSALPGSESMWPQMFMFSQHHCIYLSHLLLKTLVSSLHNKDPKLCCMGNRNKLYIKFALEGAEVIGSAITPAFLTNSWRPREAWPSSVLLQQRAVIHCQWAQPWKAGQLPSSRKGKAGKLANVNVRGAGLGETDDNVGSSEKKTIKNTCKGSAWASSPHFRRNTHVSKSSRIRYAILAAF